MSAREMQLLLEEIDAKQRLLALPQTRRPRSWVASVIVALAVIGYLSAFAGVGLLYLGEAQLGSAESSRALVQRNRKIPWRHYLGTGTYDQRCDLWVSVLGMAEIECGGRTLYRGFGLVDHDGSFRSLQQPDQQSEPALIDVRQRRAAIGDFHIRDLQDESLLEPVPDPWPPQGPDLRAEIDRLVEQYRRQLDRCQLYGGWLDVHVEIDGHGQVTNATVLDPEVARSDARCVTKVIRKWRFPAVDMEWQADIPLELAD